MKTILKAGAVIIRSSKNYIEVLLLFRKKHEDWTFPKGHCNPGESGIDAMTREVKEETDLSVQILKELPSMLYHDSRENRVQMYMFLVSPIDVNQKPRPEHPGDTFIWLPLYDAQEKISYSNLKKYFKDIIPLIELCKEQN